MLLRPGGRDRHGSRGNINYESGYALFEATHGTAPKYANLDKVNPSSVILSGAMMLEYLGWPEAASRIEKGLEKPLRPRKSPMILPA